MNESAPTPYDWLKQVPSSLLLWDRAPLSGNGPCFPWESFSENLSQSINIEDLKIEPTDLKWMVREELIRDIPNASALSFGVVGIQGLLTWVLSQEDLDILINVLVTQNKSEPFAIEREMREGFHRFLGLEAIYALKQTDFDSSLTIQIAENVEIPKEDALAVDIKISINGSEHLGRVLIPSSFLESWAARYSDQATPYSERRLSSALEVTVHLEAGKTTLHFAEWNSAKVGDFIVLDSCSIDPSLDKKGKVTLTALGLPLFRAKIGQDKIKIIEFPQFREVDSTMNDEIDRDDEESLTEEDLNLEEDDLYEEDEGEEEELEDLPQEEDEKEEEDLSPKKQEEKSGGAKELLSPAEIPMTITVEVARLQLSLQKLMELEPGNMIDLGVSPNNGVDLLANGKRIGRGELLKIGEVLGVRILEKG